MQTKQANSIRLTELPAQGQLSRHDIERELNQSHRLIIYPHLKVCQKPASYDLTPTIIAMSAKTGYLQNVYREVNYVKDRYYIYVGAKDTVLIVSNEYLHTPSNIAGYVCSRVSKVVEGFGHISTTIDPNWSGAALIALSNPSSQPLKVFVGDLDGTGSPNPLATITLHYLAAPCTDQDIDSRHQGMRIDLLRKLSYDKRRGFWAFWRRHFYRHRKKFTDYFFDAYDSKYRQDTLSKWDAFLQEFSYTSIPPECAAQMSGKTGQVAPLASVPPDVPPKTVSRKAQLNAKDFVITENIWNRMKFWFFRHWRAMGIAALLLFLVLRLFGVLPDELFERLSDFLPSLTSFLP